ncbi:MAG TPA: hypothetical protein VM677_14205 [Actinokineospora sp.]|nr:hypothetical protein [Actinokineospora sp.]
MRRPAFLIAPAVLALSLIVVGGSADSAEQADAVSLYRPITPTRVLDTRVIPGNPVGAGQVIRLDLAQQVPASATAVVLNVTGTAPTGPTFVTVYPHGVPRPTASNLNLTTNDTRPNLVTVALGAARDVDLFNHNGSVHLIADLAGYYATSPADADSRFTALSPARVLDTRQTQSVGPGATLNLVLGNRIPVSATAVVLNLTGTNASAGTFVTAWPTGQFRPVASNLNLTPGQTAPNLVTVAVGTNRSVNLFNNAGTVDLIADLAGFYTAEFGAGFTPVTPKRVLDTRTGLGPLGAGAKLNLSLAGSVPASTTGVVMNLTGTEPTAATFAAAWPFGDQQPTVSNLNLAPGQTAPNLAALSVGPNTTTVLYNNSGFLHLIADLAGYFSLPQFDCGAGCVVAWGSNESGQLGTGSVEPGSAAPTGVYGLSNVTAIAGGRNRGYALRADGTVWSWGLNANGQLGTDWIGPKSIVPVRVTGLNGVTAIDDRVALRSDGTVLTWGGLPPGSSNVPTNLGVTDATAVATAVTATGYLLKADGTVWSWGDNLMGARGGGPNLPGGVTQVVGLTGVTKIVGGNAGGYALKSDGTLWAWGDNRAGQLGNGLPYDPRCVNGEPGATNCFSNVPVQVAGLTGVTAVGADERHGFAVLADGTAWAWGNNGFGSLGVGKQCAELCETTTPMQIVGLADARSITATGYGGYATDAAGRVWSWGDNSRGQLGPVTAGGTHSTVAKRLDTPIGASAVAGGDLGGFALVP